MLRLSLSSFANYQGGRSCQERLASVELDAWTQEDHPVSTKLSHKSTMGCDKQCYANSGSFYARNRLVRVESNMLSTHPSSPNQPQIPRSPIRRRSNSAMGRIQLENQKTTSFTVSGKAPKPCHVLLGGPRCWLLRGS